MSRKRHTAPLSTAERFWPKVRMRSTGCWLWMGSRHTRRNANYGLFRVDGKTVVASRVAWMLAYGAIPIGLHVLHRCDNPPCCRPSHLFLGTQKANAEDRRTKGRQQNQRGDLNSWHKLTWRQVRQIRKVYALNRTSTYALAKRYGVGQYAIWCVVTGKTWKEPRNV